LIKVLVADDSPTARALLVAIFHSDPGLTVVGEATDGREALEMTRRLRPDVVTMDIRMPAVDGYEATRRIMSEVPTPIVVVSGRAVLEIESSLEAVRAGALAVIEKPAGPSAADFAECSRQLLDTVRAMAGVKLVKRYRDRPSSASAASLSASGDGRRDGVSAICIAASTGGPAAIQSILSALPSGFPVPILIVQHIAKGFASGLATWLDRESKVRVKVAEPEELLVSGTAYVAPDDHHLGIRRTGRIVVSAAQPIDGFRPSASFLFESAADALGSAALGVILTGMGNDGIAGLRRLKATGARIIAQDEASSIVFGMPAAAIEAGLADEVVALADVPVHLLKACEERTAR
jgi:two-component system chemotaxis response regulator CheB